MELIQQVNKDRLPKHLAIIMDGSAKKGDVLGVARLAGIMAAKKTHELIPLCWIAFFLLLIP